MLLGKLPMSVSFNPKISQIDRAGEDKVKPLVGSRKSQLRHGLPLISSDCLGVVFT